ncbi:MAG: hypothetical protein M0C28_17250 [Candidatus Moduliflexus flocculans]|nr:hypothetical protein [Candidatus Moduliflexus flocculans]
MIASGTCRLSAFLISQLHHDSFRAPGLSIATAISLHPGQEAWPPFPKLGISNPTKFSKGKEPEKASWYFLPVDLFETHAIGGEATVFKSNHSDIYRAKERNFHAQEHGTDITGYG